MFSWKLYIPCFARVKGRVGARGSMRLTGSDPAER